MVLQSSVSAIPLIGQDRPIAAAFKIKTKLKSKQRKIVNVIGDVRVGDCSVER